MLIRQCKLEITVKSPSEFAIISELAKGGVIRIINEPILYTASGEFEGEILVTVEGDFSIARAINDYFGKQDYFDKPLVRKMLVVRLKLSTDIETNCGYELIGVFSDTEEFMELAEDVNDELMKKYEFAYVNIDMEKYSMCDFGLCNHTTDFDEYLQDIIHFTNINNWKPVITQKYFETDNE